MLATQGAKMEILDNLDPKVGPIRGAMVLGYPLLSTRNQTG